jgi:very-short-patch-repair endonuclease
MTTGRLIPPARSLRQSAGLAEARAWARLRGGGVDGWKVRRQHPVGRFVADFAITPLRLVIEIDGGVHGLASVASRDAERQAEIERLGWTVIRFTNDQALAEPWRIDDAIRAHAKALGLSPSPDGRGLEPPGA